MADVTLHVGDSHTIYRSLETLAYDGDWGTTAVSSATIFVISTDQEDFSAGTVDSATASTVVDADFADDDDFWIGISLEFTSGDCKGEVREVSDFASASGTFTLDVTGDALPATPSAGDTFLLRGYPIITRQDLNPHADGTVSNDEIYFQLTSSNGATATPGRREVIIAPSWTGADSNTDSREWHITVQVRPS